MKRIIFLVLVFIGISSFAQRSINNYKYIVVPEQFNFLKNVDEYQTSSLTKFLFKREGFQTFMIGESLPTELRRNRCLSLTANLQNRSNLLTTKVVIQLKNCDGKIVYTSLEGGSKIKDYKKSYHQAIRNAFKSIEGLHYSYKPLAGERKKLGLPKKNKESKLIKREVSSNKPTGVFRAEKREESLNSNRGNRINYRTKTLFAKRVREGFELYNRKEQCIFSVLKTNLKDVFVIKDKNGILYKENNIWIADFYEARVGKVIEEYDIRLVEQSRR